MNAYVLIGSPNARKSSIIRALTGCFNRGLREIRTTSGQTLRVYVRVNSLQESKTTPEQFLEEAKERAVRNVLFSLWPHQRLDQPNEYPDAQGYLRYLHQHGWEIPQVAILGQSSAHLDFKEIGVAGLEARTKAFPNTFMDPVNVSAAGVRAHFGWV